jgi:hypothetical protein
MVDPPPRAGDQSRARRLLGSVPCDQVSTRDHVAIEEQQAAAAGQLDRAIAGALLAVATALSNMSDETLLGTDAVGPIANWRVR